MIVAQTRHAYDCNVEKRKVKAVANDKCTWQSLIEVSWGAFHGS
jgi:hypothetical protein